MSNFRYTPYDGSARPFTMGLHLCAPEDWIEIDDKLLEQLARKAALLSKNREDVYSSLPGAHDAEHEVLDVLVQHLSQNFPDIYTYKEGEVSIKPTGQTYRLGDFDDAPLTLAGRLVQEDFCIIQQADESHVLSAACLCFPSSWRLADKIGKPLEQVHAPVPGYAQVLARKVNLVFDRLLPGKILWRQNWSLDEGPELHRPAPHSHADWLQSGDSPVDHLFIRVERQTLRRLPKSGAVLFSIRIHTDSLSALAENPKAKHLAAGLMRQLEEMTPEEISYKGLAQAVGPIIHELKRLMMPG